MTDAVMKFIMLVEVHFPRPKFNGDEDREALWMRSMREILTGYRADVLNQAAAQIIRTRDPKKHGGVFPKPFECKEVCNEIAEQLERKETPLLPKAEKGESWSDDRLALAFDLVNGEMGRRAAREGWISSLYHFARKNMRLPQPDEVKAIVASRSSLVSFIERLRDKERPTSVDAALISMAGSVEKRREELCEAVLNGVVENKSWFLRG